MGKQLLLSWQQINIIMFPIIDFRNGRYQGQTKNHLPDGVGILIDKNQMFCLAEWTAGEIRGPAVIIYPSGQTFCGHIAYQKPQQLSLHEIHLDHVQLIAFSQPRMEKDPKKIAAVLPLLGVILEIDNTNPREAVVTNEYTYSTISEDENVRCISNILNLDSKGPEALKRHTNCIKFMQEYFAFKYEDIIEFLVKEKNGKKQYFFGLRGEGLGIKIEPLEELTVNRKQTGRVYIIRALGVFTRQNQMKDLGFKTLDNAMKGYIFQQGIYSLPNTLIKYEVTEEKPRPVNCLSTFYNYLKRSLHYRDKVILTGYMYSLQNFVGLFNEKLRKIETERLAHMTIEKPNNSGANLQAIEQIRSQKQRQKQEYLRKRQDASKAPNPYNPSPQKFTNPQYNLQRARDQIYRSVNKIQKAQDQVDKVDYKKVEYIDPNYRKVSSIDKQPRNYQSFLEKDKSNDKKYQYQSGKDYVKDLNQYYEKNFTPKKYDTMDTSNRKDRGESRSPIGRNYPQRSYQKRSPPPRVTPQRNYRDRSPKYTPQRNYQYITDANDPDRFNQDSLEYRPYQRQQRYRSRPYNDPRQEISYERSRPRDNYDYYDSRPYERSPYRPGQARIPGRPISQYSRSPGTNNLRKKVVEQNRYDYN